MKNNYNVNMASDAVRYVRNDLSSPEDLSKTQPYKTVSVADTGPTAIIPATINTNYTHDAKNFDNNTSNEAANDRASMTTPLFLPKSISLDQIYSSAYTTDRKITNNLMHRHNGQQASTLSQVPELLEIPEFHRRPSLRVSQVSMPSASDEQDAEEQEIRLHGPHMSVHGSALYGLMIIVTSICLTFTSQIKTSLNSNYSRWFDTTILMVAIAFLVFSFAFLFRTSKTRRDQESPRNSVTPVHHESSFPVDFAQQRASIITLPKMWMDQIRHSSVLRPSGKVRVVRNDSDAGSFYLKMGALIFAIASMIYFCLEMGIFIENTICFNEVMGVSPVVAIIFITLQLYFIFRNSRFRIARYQLIGRFGLMHLVATDLCICFRTLVDETVHEFQKILREQSEDTLKSGHGNTEFANRTAHMIEVDTEEVETITGLSVESVHQSFEQLRQASVLGSGAYNPLCVGEESIMNDMLEVASTFLFPCMIEYALICAGIVFVMWRNVGTAHGLMNRHLSESILPSKERTVYSVDCDHAAKGLFAGMLVIVMTIVGLIMFFVYGGNERETHTSQIAIVDAYIMEITLNTMGIIAVVYCMVQFLRNLRRVSFSSINIELDDSLLMVSMVGVYSYCIASLLGTHMTYDTSASVLSITASVLTLVQATLQTVFIIDANKRVILVNDTRYTNDLRKRKPARETITFLLILNFALWAINVFCDLDPQTTPTQSEFYGIKQWTITLHVTVPLVIFYRFHSTACLFEIWKRAYKQKDANTH